MFGKIGAFFSEAKQELAKVSWPTRDELFDATLLVIVVTFLMAIYVFAIDIVLSFLVRIVIH